MAEPYSPTSSELIPPSDGDMPEGADVVFLEGDDQFSSSLFADEPSEDNLTPTDDSGDIQASPSSEPANEVASGAPEDGYVADEWNDPNINLKWSGKRRTRYASTVSQGELKALTEQSSSTVHCFGTNPSSMFPQFARIFPIATLYELYYYVCIRMAGKPEEEEQNQVRAATQNARALAQSNQGAFYRHTMQPDSTSPKQLQSTGSPGLSRATPVYTGPIGASPSTPPVETDADGRPLPPLHIRQRYQSVGPSSTSVAASAAAGGQDDKTWGSWIGKVFGSDEQPQGSPRQRPVTVDPSMGRQTQPQRRPTAQPSQPKPETSEERRNRQYDEYLQKARAMDFEDVKKHQVLVGNMPKTISLDQLFYYFIALLDPIVEKDYVLVYVHQDGAPKPPLSWIRKVYGLFNRKYKKNLKQLFVMYPTFWVKTMFGLFKPFISSKFWAKLVYIQTPNSLYEHMHPDQVNLPDYTLPAADREKKLKLFGLSLSDTMRHPTNVGRDIPRLVEDAIACIEQKALETEGIFRLSGNINRIKELKAQLDAGKMPDLFAEAEIHDVSGLLKLWLRELAEPLIPYPLYDNLIEAFEQAGPMSPKERVKATMWSMPLLNLIILEKLMIVLNKVTKREKVNKMNSSNLSIVFAPNLLRAENESPAQALMHASIVPAIIKFMIEDPEDTLGSVRQLKSGDTTTSTPGSPALGGSAPPSPASSTLAQAPASAAPADQPSWPRSSRRMAAHSAVYQPVNPDDVPQQ